MKLFPRLFGAAALAALLFFATYLVWSHRAPIAPMPPLPRRVFSPRLVAQGEKLAAVGDCQGCHSVSPLAGLAGGKAVHTPLGDLYGPNITPDRQTGIGTWSLKAFDRALRNGVGRDGRHLYPGMPYDHFAILTHDDMTALYAYLMSRQPVHAIAPANRLIFPVSFRPFLAAWKALFIREDHILPPPSHDPVWNRGAYLANGLAHCGACHTPRNWMQGERYDRPLAGGWADRWTTPPLDGRGKNWTTAQIETYLSTGHGPDGTHARGPMAAVVQSLTHVPREDVHAIAVYIGSRMTRKPAGVPAE